MGSRVALPVILVHGVPDTDNVWHRLMPRKPFLVLCLLFLVAVEGSGAQAGALQGTAGDGPRARPNTWSARSSKGLTLSGTWTAVADPTTGTVTGTWTRVDGKGRTVRRGGWSAAKSPAGWTGAWRAAASGSKAEYSGTWSAGVELKADARFADLFEMAVQTVVSGNWRAGRQSGTWSIRAFD
jgi:hypothetical protein